MIPNTQALPFLEVFPNPQGREYTLQWANGPESGKNGYIRMTDLLFNYYFYPLAFGFDGALGTRSVRAVSGVQVERRIGGPKVSYNRAAYTKRTRPTFRTAAYDTGHQMFAMDGDDLWDFEVGGGDLAEFRIWLDNVAALANLKRTLSIRDHHGVGTTHTPLFTQTP
jgi:hypothetical protein